MIPFKIINLDKPRKMKWNYTAMVEFEEITGLKLQNLEKDVNVTNCLKVLWIMLKQFDEGLTFKDLLKILDEVDRPLEDIMKEVEAAKTAAMQKEGTIPNAEAPKE